MVLWNFSQSPLIWDFWKHIKLRGGYLTLTFRVRVVASVPETFTHENGILQGGMLSPTLFIVLLNSLENAFPRSLSYGVCR